MSLCFAFMPFQVAGGTILWKTMNRADSGSYTSTVALVRNFCTGSVVAISGFLIKWTGICIVAFWFGFALRSLALIVFSIYRHFMHKGNTSRSAGKSTNADFVEGATALAEPTGVDLRTASLPDPIVATL